MSMPTGYRHEAPSSHPSISHSAYGGNQKRAPTMDPVRLVHTLSEITGPGPGWAAPCASDADITHCNGGEALGERIIVSGRVLDEDGTGSRARSSRSGKPMQRAAMTIRATAMTRH
jgi:protocatechuate 3,4-dioxygenase, beta subunit